MLHFIVRRGDKTTKASCRLIICRSDRAGRTVRRSFSGLCPKHNFVFFFLVLSSAPICTSLSVPKTYRYLGILNVRFVLFRADEPKKCLFCQLFVLHLCVQYNNCILFNQSNGAIFSPELQVCCVQSLIVYPGVSFFQFEEKKKH